ncbi:hypothetical protein F5146DRAFT_503294 [Armillaria mellea]|nr:hypothetical protein F5146DRAFT_503294 [Armillaria mellea]
MTAIILRCPCFLLIFVDNGRGSGSMLHKRFEQEAVLQLSILNSSSWLLTLYIDPTTMARVTGPSRQRNRDYRHPPPYSAKPMEQAFLHDQRPQHTHSKLSPIHQHQRSRAAGTFSKRQTTVVHGTPRPRRRLTKPPPDAFVPLPGTRPRQSRPKDWRADYRPGRPCGWQGGCCLSSCLSLLCCKRIAVPFKHLTKTNQAASGHETSHFILFCLVMGVQCTTTSDRATIR